MDYRSIFRIKQLFNFLNVAAFLLALIFSFLGLIVNLIGVAVTMMIGFIKRAQSS